jgi:hypothetical protein
MNISQSSNSSQQKTLRLFQMFAGSAQKLGIFSSESKNTHDGSFSRSSRSLERRYHPHELLSILKFYF